MVGRYMKDKLKKIFEGCGGSLRYYSGIFLEGLSKTTKIYGQEYCCPYRDST
jgi:hypothetical protein